LAKLIRILAASLGGGLVLGAGIKLGEAIAAQIPVSDEPGRTLAQRLGELENRLLSLEAESPAAAGSPQTSLRLRGELRDWLEDSVTVRMAEVEMRLRADSERGQKQMLDDFAENVQTRVMHRISRLEEEVAGQSAAMNELRECSLRTERSVHKLLGGLDRLIVKNAPATAEEAPAPKAGPAPAPKAEPAPAAAPQPAPVIEPPPFQTPPKSSRWKFFG
jgi:uncharacterized coiled-coil protein SlyX